MGGVLANVDLRTRLAGHNRLELLLFRLHGEQLFGINVFKVQEVIRCPSLTSVPNSHPVVRGIMHMRGRTITVIDLDRATGGAGVARAEDSFIVITEYNQYVQGFLVAGVDRIVNMNWEDILAPPGAIGSSNYLTAVTRVDDELIEIIDVEKVLSEVMGWNEEVSPEYIEEASGAVDGPGPMILVADDSSVARNQIKRTLDQLGLECTLAMNGRMALQQLQAWLDDGVDLGQRLCMVISDIEMPEMDGYTFTTEVRRNPQMQGLHILLHTSLSGVFNNAMIDKVGADDFIAKFQPDLLASTVLKRLKSWQQQQKKNRTA